MLKIKHTEQEIDDLRNRCMKAESVGYTKFPGESYENGIRAGIDWLLGESDDDPLE